MKKKRMITIIPCSLKYGDTARGEVEDQEELDDRADDIDQAIADARKYCETEMERLKFDQMLEDHNKLFYPTCEGGQKNLGRTLELLK
jgi:hypothetical protein